MTGKSSYLDAALIVMQAHGKAMHYESIAALAVKLGYLATASPNCGIAMSSAISREIRENPNSHFAKVAPGVYKLKPSGLSCLLVPADYRFRVRNLQEHLGAKKSITVLRKGLFLLQQVRRRAEGADVVVLSYRGRSIRLDVPELLEEAENYIDAEGVVYERANRDIVFGLESIQRSLGLRFVASAVYAAVGLLEKAVSLGISESGICKVEGVKC